MSRAIWINVAIVSGLSASIVCAHAASEPATNPGPITSAALAATLRDNSCRLVIAFRDCVISFLPKSLLLAGSLIATVLLQDFDFVSVWIFYKEEAGQKFVSSLEVHDFTWGETLRFKP
jgi:hypothetical protein